MKKIIYYGLIMLVLCSCNKTPKDETDAMSNSDEFTEQLEQNEMDEMMALINNVSACLDSIQIQEHMIFNQGEGSTDMQKMVIQLSSFKDLLARKQNQIEELIKENTSLNQSTKKTIQNLQKMIKFLNIQLTEKSQKIEHLEELCQNKDTKIDELRYNINQLSSESDYLKEQNYQQDKEINACFYYVASKADLKENGLLKGGFLKKSKIDNAGIDKSLFKQVDIRSFKELVIKSASPKIMTSNPDDSYTLTKNEDGTSTLKIENAEKFWNVSKYLIIQL